ncbi:transmembrane protein 6/97 [Syncephalis fuscata]|nr:transmembrane protein 6/97 [Syncephalis fuscata]
MNVPWPVVDRILLGYFLTHIPASIFIDAQALLPAIWVPLFLKDLRAWYAYMLEDPFMRPDRPTDQLVWFRAMIACELCLQLPIMLLAVQAFWPWSFAVSKQTATNYVDNIRRLRVPLLIFGVHTATTLVPVLAELYAWPTTTSGLSGSASYTDGTPHKLPISVQSKAILYSFYIPYLVGPLLLVWRLLPLFQDAISVQTRPVVQAKKTKTQVSNLL